MLFPGAVLPLRIFEPRYRALIADCERGDRRFGIVLAARGAERALPRGHVGCVAELRDVQPLADGRSNVVVEGAERFAIERLVDADAPYHVAEVTPWDDDPAGEAASDVVMLDAHVRAAFGRVARAARTIADDRDPIPTLPPEPAALAFAIAALVDFDLPTRQRLLASRSAADRLRQLDVLLARAVPPIEERAAVHVGARGNGHGPHGAAGGAADAMPGPAA